MNKKILIICRGGGDLATGIVHRLFRAGFPVLVLETDSPAAIRRQVSFSEAVYDGMATVEGVTAERIASANRASVNHVLEEGRVPLLVDPEGSSIPLLKPDIVVDAIIAKKNLGTAKEMVTDLPQVRMWIWWWNPCGAIIWRAFLRPGRHYPIPEFPVTSAVLQKRGFYMRRQPVI